MPPLIEDLRKIADAAARYCDAGEDVVGIVPTEPAEGVRAYLCAFGADDETRSWIVLDDYGRSVRDRALIRDVVSIAAMCELAEEFAAGGDLDELRSRLVALRLTESPPGVEEAEEAALVLQSTIGGPPQVASPDRLDAVGSATRRLEQALDDHGSSPFSEAMRQAMRTVDALRKDVETHYKRELN
jgi:hypothetical protein